MDHSVISYIIVDREHLVMTLMFVSCPDPQGIFFLLTWVIRFRNDWTPREILKHPFFWSKKKVLDFFQVSVLSSNTLLFN